MNNYSLRPVLHQNYRVALTFLLLLTLGYGTLVESVHRHGCPWSRNSEITAAAFESPDSNSSHDGHTHSIECSFCQLQRQLFGNFVHSVLFTQPVAQTVFIARERVSYLSTPILPSPGRAPPLA
ncbi:MAG TPA: hypothetical protein VI306_26310 [Pyrinomonadaceae bacterium]